METEPFRIDKNTMNRLRMHIAQKASGRIYGEIGVTIEKAINEYLDREENCRNMILTKRMDSFNTFVDVKSNDEGRVVMLHPVFKGHEDEKEDLILIRAGNNKLKLTIRDADKEIENETEIRLFIEDYATGYNKELVGDCLYEEIKNGITIKKEVRIPIHKALTIYVLNYSGKELRAENVMFNIDFCPGKKKISVDYINIKSNHIIV